MDNLSNQPGQSPAFVLANAEEASGFDFWGVLNRRKWLVFLGLVTGMGLGGLYHAQCEVIYESEATVKIEPKNPAMFRFSNNDPIAPNMENFTTRHDRLIGQYNIINACLTKSELNEVDLTKLDSLGSIPVDDIVSHVSNNLEVTPDKEEPVIYELKYYSTDPDEAKIILNNIIDTYKEALIKQYATENTEYLHLLRQVQTEFKQNYLTLQDQLKTTLEQENALGIDSDFNPHQMAMTDLSRSLQESRDKLAVLYNDRERSNAALAKGPEEIESLVWILNNEKKILDIGRQNEQIGNDEVLIKREIDQLEMELEQLSQRVGPSHPNYKVVKKQLEFRKNQLDGERDEELIQLGLDPEVVLRRYLLSLNQRISDEELKIENNSAQLILHETEFQKIASVQRRIDQLRADMKDANEFVNIGKKKIVEVDPTEELNNMNDNQGFRFEPLRNASVGKRVWPILPVILGIGGLLGLLAGFGLGCLVELADKTFHNPDEVMKQLNVPLIGHVPVISQSKRYLVENSLIEPIVCCYHRPKSQVSESFRAVRTALYFNTQGKHHSVIQVTSPTPGDGKSTLASNLAVSIAQSGKRVLLVDGDMRRPRQAATFGISSKEGFATVLSGQSQWRDVVYECEEIEGLSVMPCGSKPNNPAELSSSPQVKELIEEMREEFDFVIIDTPPLLAVTDACPIAARVDGVVLCIRIKKNVRVSAERATEMLTNLGANCIGLVVNGVGAQSGYGSQYTYGAYRAGYSYNGYGYGYGYGYGAGKYYDDERKAPHRAPSPKHIEAQRTEEQEQHPPVA